MGHMTDIGGLLKGALSIVPQSTAAATVNGSSVDRLATREAYQSCKLMLALGAVSGTPTATSVVATLQHSDDNSTWAAYKVDAVTQAVTGTAANTQYELNVPLLAAKRYLRVSAVVTFTDGSSPAVLIASNLVLGGGRTTPAV